MIFRLLIGLVFLFYGWGSLYAEIRVIPQREYFTTIYELLNQAESSIEVEMYLAYSNNPQVKELLDELIKAKDRGVKLDILLEDGQEENKATLEYLRDRGVVAKFDGPDEKLHAKLILVDGKKLVIGSSNWTDKAFTENNESNVLVDLVNMREGWEDRDCIFVPPELWTLGWIRKLSCPELYAYLVNLSEFKKSSYKPAWINSQEKLCREYGIGRNTIASSLKKLMYYNLIEIKHDIPDPGQPFNKRRANRYFINSFWSEEELELKWKELSERHGLDLFHKARDLAARINEPYDPKIAASFIMLIKIYGIGPVEEVVDTATKRSFENGKWELRYIIGMLKDYSPLKNAQKYE